MGTLQFSLGTVAGAAVSVWHDGTALPLAVVMAACGVGAVTLRVWARAGLSASAVA